MLDTVKRELPIVSLDKMDRLRAGAASMRDAELAVKDAEERLEKAKAHLNNLKSHDLPDLFAEAGTDHIGLPEMGNLPGCDIKLHNYYHAVIPKNNPQAAFDWLDENGHEDLSKSTFTIKFGLRDAAAIAVFRESLIKCRIAFEEKRDVPWQTLTAFVREQIEKFGAVLPLDVLGATVGTVAQIVYRKEKKVNTRK